MKKILIGITGRTGNDGIAGCGKDTVAEMISNQVGIPIYGFADPIYDMVKSGFGIDGKDEFWSSRKQKESSILWLSKDRDVSLRYLLETLGTEWGRNMVCSDLWTAIARRRYEQSERGLIIKDVRFGNEVEWLKVWDGVLIHVIRPNYFSEATKGHPSNIPLSIGENDLVVINDDSLEVLQERVLKVLEKIV